DALGAGCLVYEVRPDVIANNTRLMEYVNRGGTYIVQYSRGNFETGGFAPYRTGKDARATPRSEHGGRRGDRGPRLFYLAYGEIVSALSSKSTAKPKVGVIGGAADLLDAMRG